MAAVDVPKTIRDDPFDVLGVDKNATDDEIKAAHRKLALKYHPDKNPGNEEAALQFQKAQTAWGILSSPELRQKYESGGMEALDDATLTEHGIQVDVSQMGIMSSTLLAMFRKLGHPIKTVVAPTVLDSVAAGMVDPVPLEWGEQAKGKVGNGQAVFYAIDISQGMIDSGFIIHAACAHARVKVLLWDRRTAGGEAGGDAQWTLAAQEDAVKIGDVNISALFHTGGDTLEGLPKSVQAHLQQAAVSEKSSDTLHNVFRVLDGAKPRDRLSLLPGTHLLAVYGDNFFRKSNYTIEGTILPSPSARDGLEKVERAILDKRSELLSFEKDFKRSKQEFEAAVQRLEEYTKEIDELFKEQEAQYISILGLPSPAVTGSKASPSQAASPRAGGSPRVAADGDAAPTTAFPAAFKSAGNVLQSTFKGLFAGKKAAPQESPERPPPPGFS